MNQIVLISLKKSFLSIIFVLLAIAGFAQEKEQTLTADDGTSFTFRKLANDSEVQSKWDVIMGVSISYADQFMPLGGYLDINYRISPKLQLNAEINVGYPVSFEESSMDVYGHYPHLKPYKRLYYQNVFLASYSLLENTTTKKSHIQLGSRVKYRGTIDYLMPIKLKYTRRLNITLGYDNIFRNISDQHGVLEPTELPESIEGEPIKYYPVNLYNNNLRVGIDWSLTTFTVVEINGRECPHYQRISVFGQMLYAINLDVNVVKLAYTDNVNYEPVLLRYETTTGYQQPEYNNVGFLIGFEITQSRSQYSNRQQFGIETGMLPGLKVNTGSPNFYIGMRIGLGFGQNLKNAYEKKHNIESLEKGKRTYQRKTN